MAKQTLGLQKSHPSYSGGMRTHIRRADDNQPEIVGAFRRLGYSVKVTSSLGGFVDLVAGKFGHNHLIEVKDSRKRPSARKLTPCEAKFHQDWKGSVHIIESVEDVIEFDRKRSKRHSMREAGR